MTAFIPLLKPLNSPLSILAHTDIAPHYVPRNHGCPTSCVSGPETHSRDWLLDRASFIICSLMRFMCIGITHTVPAEASKTWDVAFLKLFLWAKIYCNYMKNTINKEQTEKIIYDIWFMKGTYDTKTTSLLIVCQASGLSLTSQFVSHFVFLRVM